MTHDGGLRLSGGRPDDPWDQALLCDVLLASASTTWGLGSRVSGFGV